MAALVAKQLASNPKILGLATSALSSAMSSNTTTATPTSSPAEIKQESVQLSEKVATILIGQVRKMLEEKIPKKDLEKYVANFIETIRKTPEDVEKVKVNFRTIMFYFMQDIFAKSGEKQGNLIHYLFLQNLLKKESVKTLIRDIPFFSPTDYVQKVQNAILQKEGGTNPLVNGGSPLEDAIVNNPEIKKEVFSRFLDIDLAPDKQVSVNKQIFQVFLNYLDEFMEEQKQNTVLYQKLFAQYQLFIDDIFRDIDAGSNDTSLFMFYFIIQQSAILELLGEIPINPQIGMPVESSKFLLILTTLLQQKIDKLKQAKSPAPLPIIKQQPLITKGGIRKTRKMKRCRKTMKRNKSREIRRR